jgi:hypothetical protein
VNRPKGALRPCGRPEAQRRLTDALQFLEAAELLEAPDVVATNAIHAAIAASDAITCLAVGQRSADGNHASAVDLLRTVDKTLAATLKRALDRKTQAGYEDGDLSSAEAANCVRWARTLVESAQLRMS